MPWSADDAKRFTRKADTPRRKRQWSEVANSALERTGSDATAIREANGVMNHSQAMNTSARAKRRMRKDPPIEIE